MTRSVQLPTWLWLEDGYWERHDERESSGFVIVDVWARPESVTWSFENGDVKGCTSPGVPWTPGASFTDCAHTFTGSSAEEDDDAFTADVTVTWIFSWAVNGAPLGDFGEPFLATTSFELQVGEIQAIES